MKKENIKINCPVCNVLLNIKNLDTHLSLVHGVYIPNLDKYTSQYNLSADCKLEIYREIEHIKELINNNIEQDRLKELQNKFKELKTMLIPRMPLDKLLKSKILAYKAVDKSLPTPSFGNEIKKFSSIAGGILKTKNFKRQTPVTIGTDEFQIMFINLVPEMIEAFLIAKEKRFEIKKSTDIIKTDNNQIIYTKNTNSKVLTQETINYGRDIKKLSNIVSGALKTENLRRQTPVEIGTNAFQDMFIELIPKIIELFFIKKREKEANSINTVYGDKALFDISQAKDNIQLSLESIETQISSEKLTDNNEIKTLDKEIHWEETSPIKEPAIIQNVLKHQADSFQYRDDEGLDSNMIIDEEQYQEEFINNLGSIRIKCRHYQSDWHS